MVITLMLSFLGNRRARLLLCLLLLTHLPSSTASDDTNSFQTQDACKIDSDCQRGGSCNLADEFDEFNHCDCKNGHGGTTCERYCPLECANGGSCRPSIDQIDPHNTNYECVCRGQWTGDLCQIPFQVCQDHTMCMHGGSCELLNNQTHTYGCNCPLGFDGGPRCAINPDKLNNILEEEIEEALDPAVIAALVVGVLIGLSFSVLIVRGCRTRWGYRRDIRSMKLNTDDAFDTQQLHESSLHSLDLEII